MHTQSHWSHLQNDFDLMSLKYAPYILPQLFSLFLRQTFAHTHTHRFLFHPQHDTGKIFHRKMDVLAFEHRAIHHTSLFFPSDTEGKTRGVCDQCALWHLNMSERWNMSMTASSGQGWLGGRGREKGRRGRITAEPEELRIAEYWGIPRWSH